MCDLTSIWLSWSRLTRHDLGIAGRRSHNSDAHPSLETAKQDANPWPATLQDKCAGGCGASFGHDNTDNFRPSNAIADAGSTHRDRQPGPRDWPISALCNDTLRTSMTTGDRPFQQAPQFLYGYTRDGPQTFGVLLPQPTPRYVARTIKHPSPDCCRRARRRARGRYVRTECYSDQCNDRGQRVRLSYWREIVPRTSPWHPPVEG